MAGSHRSSAVPANTPETRSGQGSTASGCLTRTGHPVRCRSGHSRSGVPNRYEFIRLAWERPLDLRQQAVRARTSAVHPSANNLRRPRLRPHDRQLIENPAMTTFNRSRRPKSVEDRRLEENSIRLAFQPRELNRKAAKAIRGGLHDPTGNRQSMGVQRDASRSLVS
jgi:hypothetical protein